MNGNALALLLIAILALSLVAHCDIRHAAGGTVHVTQTQPSCSAPGLLGLPGRGQAAAWPPAPGHPQKGACYGPATSQPPSQEDNR